MDIVDQTKAVLAQILDCDVSTPTPASTITALGGDSLDEIEFIIALEDKFQISIPDVAVQNVRTVQDAADLVSQLRAG